MNHVPGGKRTNPKLWEMTYSDHNAGIRLTAYADTLVFDNDGNRKMLAAARFGGYAEHVRGMADAIYGGGTIFVGKGNERTALACRQKQYRREITNDGVYTEATLLINDDRLNTEGTGTSNGTGNGQQPAETPRTSYIFCEQSNMDRLFEEIDKKVSVPLIPEFRDYVIQELQNRDILKKLTVISLREKFDAWKIALTGSEANVTKVIEDGLASRIISIPASVDGAGCEEDPLSDMDINPFEDISTVSSYLNHFGVLIAEKIKGQFTPLFDPSTESLSQEILTVNASIKRGAGYSLYDAQLAEAEAMKRRLDKSKFALCVAECGSGKTKIGTAALYAHQLGQAQRSAGSHGYALPKTFNIVLCPSHLSKKWVREIEESLPDTVAVHVKSITELNRVYAAFVKDRRSCYIVITKEKARDGYMKRPSVRWNKRQRAFLCPHCYQPIMMDVFDDGIKYKTEADQFFFQKENSKNHKCEHCGSLLWTALVPGQQCEWVKISNYGFIHRKQAGAHYDSLRAKVIRAHSGREKTRVQNKNDNGDDLAGKDKGETASANEVPENPYVDPTTMGAGSLEGTHDGTIPTVNKDFVCGSDDQITEIDGVEIKFPKTVYDIGSVVNNPDGHFPTIGAHNRSPLSSYLNQKFRGRVDGLIVDELQDYAQDSGQGQAMNELFGCAKKVIGLTGTLINGYSQGIFYLLYRVAPQLMRIDDMKYKSTKEFNDEYGVTESVYEITNPEYNANRRSVRRKIREKQLPGVSPLVYSRFLIESTAFLSLHDMGKQLPAYEEIPVELHMTPDVFKEYRRIEDEFISIMKADKKVARRVMSAFMGLLTVYPDQPYGLDPIVNPTTGATLITPSDQSGPGVLNGKDHWLLRKIREKVSRGDRVIVYTSWIRIDTQDKLKKLFTVNNIKADVLTASVTPNKREEWVEKRVKEGVQVLITNPALVETGLDLNDFTTLVYYNISYKLFTLRQSSRRSWRINQRAPRIEVYFLYFKNAMQHRAIRLMASKLAVAGIIEGNFTDEGLAAMSECQDLTTIMAQELTLGIRDEVEDLGTVFKKMSILKPVEATPEPVSAFEETDPQHQQDQSIELSQFPTEPSDRFHAKPQQSPHTLSEQEEDIREHFLTIVKSGMKKQKGVIKKKPIYVDPNQLSLFDWETASA